MMPLMSGMTTIIRRAVACLASLAIGIRMYVAFHRESDGDGDRVLADGIRAVGEQDDRRREPLRQAGAGIGHRRTRGVLCVP